MLLQGLGSRISGPIFGVPGPTYEMGLRSQVLGLIFRFLRLRSRVPPMRWVPGLGSWVLSTVPGFGSHFLDMLCYSSFDIEIYFSYKSSINSHQSYFFLRVANFEAFLIKMLKSDSHPPKKRDLGPVLFFRGDHGVVIVVLKWNFIFFWSRCSKRSAGINFSFLTWPQRSKRSKCWN